MPDNKKKKVVINASDLNIPPGPEGDNRRRIFEGIKEGIASGPETGTSYETRMNSDPDLRRMNLSER